MEFNLVHQLSEEIHNKISAFISTFPFVAAEQNPEWISFHNFSAARPAYCYALNSGGSIVFFAVVLEKKILRKADIEFGPLFSDTTILTKGLNYLYNAYRKKFYGSLEVQIPAYENEIVAFINNKTRKELPSHETLKPWTSLIINLTKPEDDIYKDFSKGHWSAAKKAIREGLTCKQADDENELKQLHELLNKVYISRGVASGEVISFSFLKKINDWFRLKNSGSIYVVKKEETVLGGIIILFQGKYARYYKGAADPDKRELPVLHLAFYHAIPELKKRGSQFLDLWGYDPDAKEGSQIYYINRFKKGFGGEVITFPEKIKFVYSPFIDNGAKGFYNTLVFFRDVLRRKR